MRLVNYVARYACRWNAGLPVMRTVPVTPTPTVQLVTRRPRPGDDPVPYSTYRPACTLQSGEQVLTDGVWRTIDRAVCVRSGMGPSQVLLYLTDGGILGSAFDFPYVSRDADEQEAAGLAEAVCDGRG